MSPPDLCDRYAASMLGLALGDALGAPAEGGILERAAWRVVVLARGGDLTWTDDTQMAIGLAESLLSCEGLDADRLAFLWAESIQPWRGYGPGARKLLARIAGGESWREANRAIFPDGSFGNGAAMRAAPLGLYYLDRPDLLPKAADRAAEITHAHPIGREGGVLIARATALALDESCEAVEFLERLAAESTLTEYRERLEVARRWVDAPPPLAEVRDRLGHSVRADESVVTAIHLFVRHENDDIEALVGSCVELGGDVDTIAAMAGALLGARRGSSVLSESLLERLEERERIAGLGRALHDSRSRSG